MKKILILSFLILLYGCNEEELPKVKEMNFDEKEALIESTWIVQKITIKYGTHDPDEAVPVSQMEEIYGNRLVGEIKFDSNETVIIKNARDEFYFNGLEGLQWKYENRFIWFICTPRDVSTSNRMVK